MQQVTANELGKGYEINDLKQLVDALNKLSPEELQNEKTAWKEIAGKITGGIVMDIYRDEKTGRIGMRVARPLTK